MIWLIVLSVVAFFVWFGIFAEFLWGGPTIERLKEVEPEVSSHALPRITILAAARNEERNIEAGVRSLLRQDYPNLEVLIVDDRSTDATPAILERLAREEPRLRVKRVRELPAGWLGKCHALWQGSREATGEWFLFTDADVVLDPTALRRAMRFARERRLEMLAATPEPTMPSALLTAFVAAFALFFNLYALPWRARNPRSSRYVGIGAFNLVRAENYRRAGGHEAIRLAVDDDMRLGKVVKLARTRQDLVTGEAMVRVEWYGSLRELVKGLEKNAFAGLEYSVPRLVAGTLVQLLMVWPWVGFPLAVWGLDHFGGSVWRGLVAMNLAGLMSLAGIYWGMARGNGTIKFRHFFAFPLVLAIFIFIIWRSAYKALSQGAIEWRGTRYSLAELRKNL